NAADTGRRVNGSNFSTAPALRVTVSPAGTASSLVGPSAQVMIVCGGETCALPVSDTAMTLLLFDDPLLPASCAGSRCSPVIRIRSEERRVGKESRLPETAGASDTSPLGLAT